MRKKIILLFVLIIIISCNSDENNNITDKTDLNLVTGFYGRETGEDPPIKYGNPNIFINDKFVIFPNPVTNFFSIKTDKSITNVWFVPANAEKIHADVNFNNVLNSNLYSEASIASQSKFTLSAESASFLSLDVRTLQKGYYKVFVKIDGQIYWDNLYKYGNEYGNESQFETLYNFWN